MVADRFIAAAILQNEFGVCSFSLFDGRIVSDEIVDCFIGYSMWVYSFRVILE